MVTLSLIAALTLSTGAWAATPGSRAGGQQVWVARDAGPHHAFDNVGGMAVSPDGTQKQDARALAAFDMTTGAWVPMFTASVTNTTATGVAVVRALGVSNDGYKE